MKRYSFDNFRITAANESACEICRHISDLDFRGPFPVTVVGEPKSGKTHLIYSIVNKIRGSSTKAALAVVTAAKFPQEVRALATDPAPLNRAKNAILLVDQLEKFSASFGDLEAVICVFLDRQHYVVIASAVPPEKLANLPPSLLALINAGTLVTLQAEKKESEVVTAESATADAEQYLGELQRQIDSLRIKLDDEQRSNTTFERDLVQKRNESSALREELDEANKVIESLLNSNSGLEEHVEALRRELTQARQEKEAASVRILALAEQVESCSTHFAQGEKEQREQLADLEAKLAAALAAPPAEDPEPIKVELGETKAKLTATLHQLEGERAEAQEEQAGAAEKIQILRNELTEAKSDKTAAAEKIAALEDEAIKAKADIESAAERIIQLENERTNLQSEQQRTAGKMAELESANEKLQAQLQELRKKFDSQSIEIDELRHEAAAQVAAAQAQAGEVERKITQLLAARDAEHAAGAEAVSDMAALRDQLSRAADSLTAAIHDLAHIYENTAPVAKEHPGNLAILDRIDSFGTDDEMASGPGRAATTA